MKILFLDFDGVLNDCGYVIDLSKEFFGFHTYLDKYSYCTELDPVRIERLNEIVDETGCFIVLSTAWRYYGLEYCKEILTMRGFRFPHRIIDITPIHDFEEDSRVQEVILWLMINDPERDLSHYVMLDDDIEPTGIDRIGKEHITQTYLADVIEGGLTEIKKRETIRKLIGDNDE